MESILIQGKGNSIYCTKEYLRCYRPKSKPKPIKFKEVDLACGREVSGVRKELVTDQFNNQLPKVLARVSVDISPIFKPLVKIDFSTLIEVRDSASLVDDGIILRFRLNRTCNGETYTLKTYEYKRIFRPSGENVLLYETKDSFCFTFCDDEFLCKNGCCTYSVELYEVQVLADPLERLVISDSAINALVQVKKEALI